VTKPGSFIFKSRLSIPASASVALPLTPFSTSGLATALLPPGMTSSNNDPRVIFGSYA
jgi:hypothetical protein